MEGDVTRVCPHCVFKFLTICPKTVFDSMAKTPCLPNNNYTASSYFCAARKQSQVHDAKNLVECVPTLCRTKQYCKLLYAVVAQAQAKRVVQRSITGSKVLA